MANPPLRTRGQVRRLVAPGLVPRRANAKASTRDITGQSAPLPSATLGIAEDEPSGAIGLSYRRYYRTVLVPLVRHVSLIMKEHATSMEMPPRPVSFATDNCRALLMAINGDDNIMDRSTTAAVGASFDHQLVNLHFARILHRCFHMSVHAAGH